MTPALTVPQVRHLLSVTLPAQRRDAAAMLAFIREVQRRNDAAAARPTASGGCACSGTCWTPPERTHVVKLVGTRSQCLDVEGGG